MENLEWQIMKAKEWAESGPVRPIYAAINGNDIKRFEDLDSLLREVKKDLRQQVSPLETSKLALSAEIAIEVEGHATLAEGLVTLRTLIITGAAHRHAGEVLFSFRYGLESMKEKAWWNPVRDVGIQLTEAIRAVARNAGVSDIQAIDVLFELAHREVIDIHKLAGEELAAVVGFDLAAWQEQYDKYHPIAVEKSKLAGRRLELTGKINVLTNRRNLATHKTATAGEVQELNETLDACESQRTELDKRRSQIKTSFQDLRDPGEVPVLEPEEEWRVFVEMGVLENL